MDAIWVLGQAWVERDWATGLLVATGFQGRVRFAQTP
jgi:hypothetical protein